MIEACIIPRQRTRRMSVIYIYFRDPPLESASIQKMAGALPNSATTENCEVYTPDPPLSHDPLVRYLPFLRFTDNPQKNLRSIPHVQQRQAWSAVVPRNQQLQDFQVPCTTSVAFVQKKELYEQQSMVRNMTWELVGSVKRIASEKENRMSIHEVVGRGDWVTDVDSKVPDTAGQRSKMLHKVSFARISSITQNNSVVATAGLGKYPNSSNSSKFSNPTLLLHKLHNGTATHLQL